MKNTDNKDQIGIWMDYSHAKFIQVNGVTKIIESGVTTHERIPGESSNGSRLGNNRSTNNESNKHNKEINETHAYFNEVYDALKSYSEIILFGPTTAPQEFHNYITSKKNNTEGKIIVKKSDYLTDNQLVEFVRNYFESVNN